MNLIDAHGGVVGVNLRALVHPLLIAPLISAQIENHTSRFHAVLGKKGIRVRLQKDIPVGTANFKFVVRALMHAGQENFPDSGWHKLPHLVHAAIPVIEIADHAHTLRRWCPYGKMNARNIADHLHMCPEFFIDVVVGSFVEKVDVHLSKNGRKRIGIALFPLATVVPSEFECVRQSLAESGNLPLKKPMLIDA